MRITAITTRHISIPLAARGRVPLTDSRTPAGPASVEMLVAIVEADGRTGIGFTYLPGAVVEVVHTLLKGELASLLIGEDPRDTDRLIAKASAMYRSVGFGGIPARAYCALDIALWDLKAKAAGVPLFKLLGNARPAAPFFASDIANAGRDASEAIKLAKPLMKQGAMGLRVAVGSEDVQADADRVRAIQEGLGDDGWVSVSANGRYDLATAQALTHFFEDIGVNLFEDPVPDSDEMGFARLSELQLIPLAVGSSFDRVEDFYRVIRAGHVRTVRPDLCRLGGLTPLLKVAAVAEAFHVAVSPVRMPEVGVHLACGLGVVPSVDYVSWFAETLTGGPRFENGKLVPPSEPGLGIALKDAS